MKLKLLALAATMLLCSCATLTPVEQGPVMEPSLAFRQRLARLRPDNHPNRWVLLIGANTELRHRGSLAIAYQALIERGHAREQIFVLDSSGPAPWYPDAEYTTKASIKAVLARLANVVEPHDALLVYVVGHGDRVAGTKYSALVLNHDERVLHAHFEGWLANVEPQLAFLVYDLCYIGALDLLPCNWFIMASASENHVSHGVTFGRAFWNHFRDTAPNFATAFAFAATEAKRDTPTSRIDGCDKPDPPSTPGI